MAPWSNNNYYDSYADDTDVDHIVRRASIPHIPDDGGTGALQDLRTLIHRSLATTTRYRHDPAATTLALMAEWRPTSKLLEATQTLCDTVPDMLPYGRFGATSGYPLPTSTRVVRYPEVEVEDLDVDHLLRYEREDGIVGSSLIETLQMLLHRTLNALNSLESGNGGTACRELEALRVAYTTTLQALVEVRVAVPG